MRLLFAVLFCFCFALCGCGVAAFKTAMVVAGLTASSPNVAFGSVPIGKTTNAYVKLVNQGSEAVTISQLKITGQNFSSSAQDGLPITVGAESSFNLGVQFSPSMTGTSSGQLTVMNTSSTNAVSVSLSGTGIAAPLASLSGLTCVSSSMTGSATDACTVTLDSVASSETTINLTSDSSAVTLPATVAVPAGSSIAAFTATVSAVSAVQTVTLTASAAGVSKTFTLQLGAVVPNLDVSSLDITFGDVNVEDAASLPLTLISTGNAPVTIDSIAISGQGYSIAGGTFPMTLNPNQTATLGVLFSPKSSGTSVGQLTISTNSTTASPKKIKLTGNAVPQIKQLICAKASIAGGSATDCAVTLNAAAATGGLAIALASSTSAVAVPASIMVPAGATSAPFTATSSTVTSSQTATLTASSGSSSKTFTLQLGSSVPTLTLSAASVAFGNVPVNSPTIQTLTLSSTGTAAVTVSAAAAAGSGFAVSGAAFPLTLNPGQTATLTVQFNPTAAGTASGQLTLSSNSSTGSSSVVSLSGTGVPVLSGLSCANGSFAAAGTDACTVTLNTAAAAGGFVVNLASNNTAVTVPASVTVPAGAISGGFTATVSTVTSSQTAILTASAGSAANTFTLQLGSSLPTLTISAMSVAFGNVAVSSSATQTLTLSSTGSAAVVVSGATVTGSGFTISGTTFPLTLNPGQTATLTVQFKPLLAGAANGQLMLTSNSSIGTSSSINLSGTGIPVLSGLSCANSSIVGAGTDNCTMTLNAVAATGGFTVNLASNNASVTVPAAITVPGGASSAAFSVTISSVTNSQTVTLTANAGSVAVTFVLQLSVGTPTLSANATSIAFGTVNLNSPTTQSIVLTSTGTAAVTISGASVTGTGFTVSGASFPLTLNPNQTATLNVVFDPTTAGSVAGQLTITSNSSTGGTIAIGLTGAGQSVSHEVDLTWSAPVSSPDPVTGYNVYRAPTGSNSYQQLNTAGVVLTSYADTNVQSGQSYNYVVKSVDAAGTTSVPSNVATVVIP